MGENKVFHARQPREILPSGLECDIHYKNRHPLTRF